MSQHELDRVRGIALALPEVTERLSHGAICFFIRDKKPVCYYHNNHRGDGRVSLWCPVLPDLRKDLIRNHPIRFFKPQMSASGVFSDWLGAYLDTTDENEVNWNQIAAIIEDAYRKVAPKNLLTELDKR